jgi:hypothetical protein
VQHPSHSTDIALVDWSENTLNVISGCISPVTTVIEDSFVPATSIHCPSCRRARTTTEAGRVSLDINMPIQKASPWASGKRKPLGAGATGKAP